MSEEKKKDSSAEESVEKKTGADKAEVARTDDAGGGVPRRDFIGAAALGAGGIATGISFYFRKGVKYPSAEDVKGWRKELYGGGETVREMKRRIEAELPRDVRKHGEVKSGVGSIRDIEFVTQFLQLQHVEQYPEILGTNTLRSLATLAAAGCLASPEDSIRH